MPTRITQIENLGHDARTFKVGKDGQPNCGDIESQRTVLRVEGTLHLKDAELLERICRDVVVQTGRPIMLDLARISFIDSESASVLCRMKREQGVTLQGLHLFIENVIELTEAADQAEKYLPCTGDSV